MWSSTSMTLAFLGALISPFNEARADETSMIPFGPHSPECVEGEFSEVRGGTLSSWCLSAPCPCSTRACLTGRCVRVIPCRKATTTGETRRDGQTRRDHRSGLARDRTPLARIRPKRGPMEGPPHRHKRHPLEAQDRLALA